MLSEIKKIQILHAITYTWPLKKIKQLDEFKKRKKKKALVRNKWKVKEWRNRTLFFVPRGIYESR